MGRTSLSLAVTMIAEKDTGQQFCYIILATKEANPHRKTSPEEAKGSEWFDFRSMPMPFFSVADELSGLSPH